MTGPRPHIIRRQSVNLQFYKHKENFFLQEKIARVLKEKITPALEKLFDEKTSGGKYIKIDSLQINLGDINLKTWEDELVETSLLMIRSKLNEISSLTSVAEDYAVEYTNDKPGIFGSKSGNDELQALIYFMQCGLLPWNFQSTNANELLEALLQKAAKSASNDEIKTFMNTGVLFTSAAFQRFLLQFSDEEIKSVLEMVLGPNCNVDRALSKIILDQKRKKIFSIFLSLLITNDEPIISSIRKIISSVDFNQVDQNEIIAHLPSILERLSAKNENIDKEKIRIAVEQTLKEQQTEDPAIQTKIKEDSYFIENAGLVILHAFLQPLFDRLHFLNEKKFIDVEFQRKAVLLSQFLVTANTEIPEHTLLLSKIICGYPKDEPVESILELTQDENAECIDILHSVIAHWTALKTTSVAGLRNSFLQREGKLTEFEDHWLLQVEQKSFDVLMNFLPWGIGIIKLPWMKKRIMVEWNS